MKNPAKIIAQLFSIAVIGALLLGFFISFAKAQVVSDPATEFNTGQTAIGVGQNAFNTGVKNINDKVDKALQTIKDRISDAAATAYDRAMGGVLNTIAAQAAKAIATGHPGNSPVFSFDKGFFSSLADAAVGDFLAGFIGGTLNIDFCNYNPQLTLQFAIPLFRDPNKYTPKCSLSQIVNHYKNIDLKKLINIDINAYTVKSFSDIWQSVTSSPLFGGTAIKSQLQKLLDKYRYEPDDPKASAFVKDLHAIQGQYQAIIDKSIKGTDISADERQVISTASLANNLKKFRCNAAKDLSDTFLAFFSNELDCSGTDFALDKQKIWPDGFADRLDFMVEPDGTAEAQPTIQTYMTHADAAASTFAPGDPFSQGMIRMEQSFKMCNKALSKALEANITTGAVSSAPVGTCNNNPAISCSSDDICNPSNAGCVPGNDVTGALHCADNLSKTCVNNSDCFLNRCVIPSSPVINGLQPSGSTFIGSVTANSGSVSYTQGGRLTNEEFVACQIAFNSGALLDEASSPTFVIPAPLFDKDSALSQDRQVMDQWVHIFNPENVYTNYAGNGPSVIDDFVRDSMLKTANGDALGKTRLNYLKAKISQALGLVDATQGVFGGLNNQLDQIFNPATFSKIENSTIQSDAEKSQDRLKSATPEGDQWLTGAKLSESASNVQSNTKSNEVNAQTFAGSEFQANRTAVSEQATTPAKYNELEFQKVSESTKPVFNCTYKPGALLSNATCTFLQVLWNESIRNALKNLNTRLQKSKAGSWLSLTVDPALQPTNKDESFLAGYTPPPKGTCNADDIIVLNTIGDLTVALGQNHAVHKVKTNEHLSAACRTAFEAHLKAKGLSPDDPAAAREFKNTLQDVAQATLSAYANTSAPAFKDTPDSSNVTQPYKYPQDTVQNISQITATDFPLLDDMVTCPTDPANPNIYSCTINSSVKDAILQGLTINQALEKGLLSAGAILGIDANGKVPQPKDGFSLSAAQKLRKARIMPLGFELAARLKVACYEKEKFPGGAAQMETDAPHFPYPYIGGECNFNLTSDKEKIYRDKVIASTLGDIISGFGDTGSLSEVCGNFGITETAGAAQTTMSPFCGLVNPDWVMKLPTPQCIEIKKNSGGEYTDILEADGSSSRLKACTELVSEVVSPKKGDDKKNQLYGYCVQERNVWDVNGKDCPAQYNTCTSYLLSGGIIESYNKDSLLGDNLCSAKNAGCTWVSTLKYAGAWQDTGTKTNQLDCQLAGGTWDATGNVCSNSRLYMTGNIGSCTADNNGCSKVFPFKQDRNNLVRDSSFEFSGAAIPPTFWKSAPYSAPQTTSIADEQNRINSCAAGVASNNCEIAYPANLSSLCLSQGGNFVADGTCHVVNHNSYDMCGYCKYTGSNPAADKSAQEFSRTDCLAQNGVTTDYSWVGGTPAVSCQTSDYNCAIGSTTCPILVADNTIPRLANANVASDGSKALEVDLSKIAADGTVSYPLQMSPAGSMIVLAGDTFTVSFDVKSDSSSNIEVWAELVKTMSGGRVDSKIVPIAVTNSYARYSISLTALTDGTDLTFKMYFEHSAAKVYLDKVQIEYNSASQLADSTIQLAGDYKAYESQTPLGVKLAPDNLKCLGYSSNNPSETVPGISTASLCTNSGYFWDADGTGYGQGLKCFRFPPDQESCSNFAPACRADEAGCQLYTPANGEPDVPGVVNLDNYCPQACNGYDAFKQQPTYFEPLPTLAFDYFIPSTAAQCKVEDVGCDEFTNTSVAAAVAPIEHYSYLKQCVVPNTGKGEKGFFTWQGSSTGAPQLKSFLLEADGGICSSNALYNNNPTGCKSVGGTFAYNGTGGPAMAVAGRVCTAADLGRDLDCVTFFDSAGLNYIRRMSYTISADASCQTLRKTASSQTLCGLTNGDWNTANNTCVYQALPSDSLACTAQVSGCRAYLGNTGSNNANSIFDSFEAPQGVSGWNYVGNTVPLNTSAESIIAGQQSLLVGNAGAIEKPVTISQNQSYKISFWAKSNRQAPTNLGVTFSTAPRTTGATAGREFVTSASGLARVTNDWKFFEFGPIFVDWKDQTGNTLRFESADGSYFLDNVTLTRLQDSTYVVKGSWTTPAICDQTNLGVPLPQAQLGCQEYGNSQKQTVYLKSFTRLCRTGSVGCQLVFDTKNSTSPVTTFYNLDNASRLDDTVVPADNLRAVVVKDSTQCQLQFAGCQEVGPQTFKTGDGIFVINNPDRYLYDQTNNPLPILCKDEELGCQAAKDSKGNDAFIKIESNNTCRFDDSISGDGTNKWVKTNQETQGCAATGENSESACRADGGAWNRTFGQCTSLIKDLQFSDCRSFTPKHKTELKDSCNTVYNGSWYDDSASGPAAPSCGCVRSPFQYYRVNEYPEHKVSAALCTLANDQCTEFLDFNPNYVANGSFEQFNDLDQTPTNWQTGNPLAGTVKIDTAAAVSGNNALRLTKKTWRDEPRVNTTTPLASTPMYIYQRLARLEKGKTYTVNFTFNSTENDEGVPAGTDILNPAAGCRLPEAASEAVPYYGQAIISQIAAANPVKNAYANHDQVKTFESSGQRKDAQFNFLIPTEEAVVPGIATDSACVAIGGFWKLTAPPTTAGVCLASNPNEPTVDYEIRIFSPLNGACVAPSGEKVYFTDNGTPLDKRLCEGMTVGQFSGLSADLKAQYSAALGLTASFIAPAAGTGSVWHGNCIDSSYTIDNFQISLAQDHLYYFIDDESLNKGDCKNQSNWDAGCISFTKANDETKTPEIIQVKADRQCSEWLYCNSRDKATGRCTNWGTCSKQDGETCSQLGSTRDPLRYKFNDFGQLMSIDINSYRKRLGISEDFKINRWRAGDYSGYTIPNYPPLEQIYDRVPGIPAGAAPIPAVSGVFTGDLADSSKKLSAIKDICRGYPEPDSPFSPILKSLVPGFEGVNRIFYYTPDSAVHSDISPFDRTIICSYIKYTISDQNYYVVKPQPGTCPNGAQCTQASDCFLPGETVDPNACTFKYVAPVFICTNSGANFGKSCGGVTVGDPSCDTQTTTNPTTGARISGDGVCQDPKDLNPKSEIGNLGACLEYDTNLKIHGGLDPNGQPYNSGNPPTESELDHVTPPDQPGLDACLTYYPL